MIIDFSSQISLDKNRSANMKKRISFPLRQLISYLAANFSKNFFVTRKYIIWQPRYSPKLFASAIPNKKAKLTLEKTETFGEHWKADLGFIYLVKVPFCFRKEPRKKGATFLVPFQKFLPPHKLVELADACRINRLKHEERKKYLGFARYTPT